MFLHLSVILCTGGKVCREGGVVDTPRPGGRHAPTDPEADNPRPTDPESDTPLPTNPEADTPLPKTKRQTPPHGQRGRHTPPGAKGRPPRNDPEADTPSSPVEAATEAGGTHPTGMHSC